MSSFKSKSSKKWHSRTPKLRRAQTLATASRATTPPAKPETAPPSTLTDDTNAINTVVLKSEGESQRAVITALGDLDLAPFINKSIVEVYPQKAIQNHTLNTIKDTGVLECAPRKASLMDIPVEVRQMIFQHALSPDNPRNYETWIYDGNPIRALGRRSGQICRLNKQCYNESVDLLYAHTFVFLNQGAMTKFFTGRSEKQLAHVREVHMIYRCSDWVPAIESIVLAPETILTVDLPIDEDLWKALKNHDSLRNRVVKLQTKGKEMSVLFSTTPCPGSKENPSPSHGELKKWMQEGRHINS